MKRFVPKVVYDSINNVNKNVTKHFSRNSTGYYLNENGILQSVNSNVERLDYDLDDSSSLGLLIENPTVNKSINFSSWSNVNATKGLNTSETLAPDGTYTALKLKENKVTSNSHYLRTPSGIPVDRDKYVTFSFYVKAAERKYIQLNLAQIGITGSPTVYFQIDLQTKSLFGPIEYTNNHNTTPCFNEVDVKIKSYPNNWCKVILTFHILDNENNNNCLIRPIIYLIEVDDISGFSQALYPGTIGYGVYLWGSQIEESNYPTSYVSTSTIEASRAGDFLAFDLSSVFSQLEGTINLSCQLLDFPKQGYQTLFNLSDMFYEDTLNYFYNRIVARLTATNIEIYNHYDPVNNPESANITTINFKRNSSKILNIAFSFDESIMAISINGENTINESFTKLDPTITEAWLQFSNIFDEVYPLNQLNGYLKYMSYYSTKLPNYKLQELTQL